MSEEHLQALLDQISAAVPDPMSVRREASPGGAAWSCGSITFAILGASGVELRLELRVAAAAARTPDAAPSPRGPEWVRFSPRDLDPHAVDRLEAWFTLAARLASGEAGSGD